MPRAAIATPPPPTANQRANLRPIDQAAAMGISEGEWLTRHAPANAAARVRRIRVRAASLLPRFTALGTVMSLTRNASCVHEKDGIWDRIEIGGAMGLVLNHDIDLRLFLNHWVHGYAVETPLENGSRHSLQFFDRAGVAVHKIFARPTTDMAAWAALVDEVADDGPPTPLKPAALPAPADDRPDDSIAIDAVRRRWAELKDVHDFFALLREEQVGRLQAMRLAGAPYSRPVPVASIQPLLEQAAGEGVPIMCFVGNRGCIQIHSGLIHRVVPMGPWLNIMDKGFNLHLRIDQVAHAFAVWKPQRDSAVHSVELFAADGTLIAQFFGERKPGVAEIPAWRALVQGLPGQ